jgi:tRNA (cytosine49-C5)-methyltransferase
MEIKKELSDYLVKNLGAEKEAFEKKPRKAFRINTIKAKYEDIAHLGVFEPIPWTPGGYFTDSDIGKSTEHFLGLIYIQEAASMLPAALLSPSINDLVLDLCAAPGSKTTQLAAIMENTGAIVANEPDNQRLKTLRFNLNRMGALNTVLTNRDGTKFSSMERFDKILVDAPCSNLGNLATNPEASNSFSKALVKKLSTLQKRLIDTAAGHIKKEGVILYSTCTYTAEENEQVIDYAIRKHNLTVEEVNGKFKKTRGLTDYLGKSLHDDISKTARIYPHHNDTCGFYLAKLRK